MASAVGRVGTAVEFGRGEDTWKSGKSRSSSIIREGGGYLEERQPRYGADVDLRSQLLGGGGDVVDGDLSRQSERERGPSHERERARKGFTPAARVRIEPLQSRCREPLEGSHLLRVHGPAL